MSLRLPFQSPTCWLNSKLPSSRISISISTSGGGRRRGAAAARVVANMGVAARDRIIYLGKHKGKMLGAIPPGYLKWASENLDAGWRKLADEVLRDPVYQDRIEWDLAHNVLSGDNMLRKVNAASVDVVDELHDIAERFGWDMEDREGWSKVRYELLGTSKSGRIPRISDRKTRIDQLMAKKKKKTAAPGGERRFERIERQRAKRELGKLPVQTITDTAPIQRKTSPRFAIRKAADAHPPTTTPKSIEDDRKVKNPFPGRDAFLKKIHSLKNKKPLE